MSDFYLVLHSDASSTAFPENRPGHFKSILREEINLGNIEYKVAISSITRYYETSMDDLAFVREKRQAPTPGIVIAPKYEARQQSLAAAQESYLQGGRSLIACGDVKDYTVKFKVALQEEEFTIFTEQEITKDMLERALTYRSTKVGGLIFELTHMAGIGKLTVAGPKGVTKTPFQVTFSEVLTNKLKLSQSIFRGELNKDKIRQIIDLRAIAVADWGPDLRRVLPFMMRLSIDNYAAKNIVTKVWCKDIDDQSKLADYLVAPFVHDGKNAYPLHPRSQYSYKLSPKLATLYGLPEEFDSQLQLIKVYVKNLKGVEALHREIQILEKDMNAAGIERLLNNANIPVPHKLTVTRVDDKKLTVKISDAIRIELPNACNLLSFESTQAVGEWPASIHYVDDGGLGKVQKEFAVPFKKTYADQVAAMQTATQKAFDAIAKEIDDKEPADDNKTTLTFQIIKTRNIITGYEIPEGYELQLDRGLAIRMKTPIHIYASNLNEFAWITCDLVSETCVGERAMRLLTPTPVKMFTDVIARMEYVPVEINTFSMVELHLFSNLKTMEMLDVPHNLLLVLHFRPRHKRKGITCDDDSIKRHCSDDDGCRSRVLQQTAGRRLAAGDAWYSG
jgi:hypothetical protein